MGVSSDGFRTTALPSARAGATGDVTVHREVPWADYTDHADRLAVDKALFAGFVDGNDAAVHAMRKR